jgi:hypothetical protein
MDPTKLIRTARGLLEPAAPSTSSSVQLAQAENLIARENEFRLPIAFGLGGFVLGVVGAVMLSRR